eukprot:TRINITY_DN7648_c0_g1_i10.p1 TRINITY_DN7648_c0_g1~~TRINITY_DN7648_c0_g1_i10.p1  ORF type:complete len:101 (-),score=18.78 TRINITY_DN7648_c0_g1_i10:105-407(-)
MCIRDSLRAGLHTCYNGDDRGQQHSDVARISKSRLSSDCSLQLESMKLESLVIADQHAAVNTFPGLVHLSLIHISEPTRLLSISYAVFCLKKKKKKHEKT